MTGARVPGLPDHLLLGELFDPTPYVVTVRDPDRYVTPGMGQDARRTARRRALIEDGVHPATRFPLTGLGSCGDCAHLILKDGPALGVGGYGQEPQRPHATGPDRAAEPPAQ